MKETFGQRFQRLRKNKNLTQDDIASKVNISPQAVSKWENDVSYPDISILLDLSKILNCSLDELLGKETESIQVLEKKDKDKLMIKIKVNSKDGDKVKINIPVALLQVVLNSNMELPQVSGNDALKNIDFNKIMDLIEQGIIGKLVEVESADGDIVEIVVE